MGDVEMGRMEMRIDRVTMRIRRAHDLAVFRDADAIEKLRDNTLKVLRYNAAKNELTGEGLFDLIAAGSSHIDEKAWLAWFETADKEIREIKAPDVKKEEPKKEEP